MSGLVEHVTRWENAHLEAIFNEDLRCEHRDHNSPEYAAFHGGPGEFIGMLPCGVKRVICRPLRDALVRVGSATCSRHGEHPVTVSNFFEL